MKSVNALGDILIVTQKLPFPRFSFLSFPQCICYCFPQKLSDRTKDGLQKGYRKLFFSAARIWGDRLCSRSYPSYMFLIACRLCDAPFMQIRMADNYSVSRL